MLQQSNVMSGSGEAGVKSNRRDTSNRRLCLAHNPKCPIEVSSHHQLHLVKQRWPRRRLVP